MRSLGIGTTAGVVAQWSMAPAFGLEPRSDQNNRLIRLDSNENAYGPSPKVLAAIHAAAESSNRYPFAQTDSLCECIASFHHVRPEEILLGCGSTEILRVAACAFLYNGKQVITASPTFEAMEQYARSAGSVAIAVPLNAAFAHDLDAMLARSDSSTGLFYICNPNNPTASLTARRDIEHFVSKLPATTTVLIDEAYCHYVGKSGAYASFLDHRLDDERLIVVRTFSKAYGMAGLRLGYAVGSPRKIQQMREFNTHRNINAIVAQAACVALEDQASVDEFGRRNANARQEFFNQAMARALKPIDSHTNFVMMATSHPANAVIDHFKKNKILIGRAFGAMNTYIRVSLGLPGEMQAFWQAWDTLPYPKGTMHH